MATHFTHTNNAEQSAQQLAQAVVRNLTELLQQQECATLAVSGGRSPIAFFQVLSQINIDWHRINIALVDERIVPTHHADSNTALVKTHLLNHFAQQARWIPMIDDNATAGSLSSLNTVLDFALQHYIQPDIVVLGMGNDGHTASIFPQAPQFNKAINPEYPVPLLHTTPITAPYERISMTLSAIEHAKYCYLAIAGQEKHKVYQQATLSLSHALPISFILYSTKVDLHVFYHH